MEKLSILISKLVHEEKWKPVWISSLGHPILHLLFADACLLFIKSKSSQLHLVNQVMHDFGKASGLMLNLDKSRMMVENAFPELKWRSLLRSCPFQ